MYVRAWIKFSWEGYFVSKMWGMKTTKYLKELICEWNSFKIEESNPSSTNAFLVNDNVVQLTFWFSIHYV